jgi:hypothetical protein
MQALGKRETFPSANSTEVELVRTAWPHQRREERREIVTIIGAQSGIELTYLPSELHVCSGTELAEHGIYSVPPLLESTPVLATR